MSRKSIFTKEEIIEKAFNFVREKGIENLSARNLAKYLGISTGPLFVAFKNFEELNNLIIEKANIFYRDNYYNKALTEKIPFKAIGLNYIKFAKDEPNLFKITFINENAGKTTHFLPSCDNTAPKTLDLAQNYYSINNEKSQKLYNHLSVYCYGIAMLFVNKAPVFTMEDVDKMLSEMFFALMK